MMAAAPNDLSVSSNYAAVGKADEEETDQLELQLQRPIYAYTDSENENYGVTEKIYVDSGCSKIALVTLCIGQVKADGKPLLDIEQPPWSSQMRATLKPSNMNLVKEVQRRQKLFSRSPFAVEKTFLMRPKNKTREELVLWLTKFPIYDVQCMRFLSSEVRRVAFELSKAEEENQDAARKALKTGAWYGNIPFLRLLHCITDCEDNRVAFLHRHDGIMLRNQRLSAQGSATIAVPAYDRIAKTWNDKSFNPETRISRCHPMFHSPLKLSHSLVATMAKADSLKVGTTLGDILINLLRMKRSWEERVRGNGAHLSASVGGDGNNDYLVPEENRNADSGKVSVEVAGKIQDALDSRVDFLNGLPLWYLYFWEQMDMHQLFSAVTPQQQLGAQVESRRPPPLPPPLPPPPMPPPALPPPTDDEDDDAVEETTNPELSASQKQEESIQPEPARATGFTEDSIQHALTTLLHEVIQSVREDRKQKREIFFLEQMNVLQSQLDALEEKYHQTGDEFYKAQISRKKARIEEYENERYKHGE